MEHIVGIYKITNTINGKSYIGQSVDIHKRWTSEKNASQNANRHEYNYPLSKALRKYGIENFSFTIIEQCPKDELNKKETYWINFYDTYFNGYNQTLGGDSRCGTEMKPKETVIGIINDLKTTNDTHAEIAKRWGVSRCMVQRVNSGRNWHHDTEYPLQKRCLDIVSGIKPSMDILSRVIKDNNGNIVAVSKHFGVSDAAVRKWIKSYQLTVVKPVRVSKRHSVANKGRTVPKCVAMYKSNQKIMCFSSINQAVEYLKTNGIKNPSSSGIASVCKGKRKSAYGYYWKYNDEIEA